MAGRICFLASTSQFKLPSEKFGRCTEAVALSDPPSHLILNPYYARTLFGEESLGLAFCYAYLAKLGFRDEFLMGQVWAFVFAFGRN